MSDLHWFDTFNTVLIRDSPRRAILGAVAAVVAALAHQGAQADAAGKKKKKKQKAKRRKKPNKPKKPTSPKPPTVPPPRHLPPPDLADCLLSAPSWLNPEKRSEWEEYCRRNHEKCPGDLCIYAPEGPDNRRGAACCPLPKTCCPDGCFDTKSDHKHCGTCNIRCAADEVCFDGHCVCGIPGACGACPDGKTRCGDECVDTQTDPRHCGGCNAMNVNGLSCCQGNLCHYIDGVCCGATCYPSYWICAP